MKCCRSCKKWALASEKVPIDVRKVVKAGEFIEIRFQDRLVKVPSWDWQTKEPISLKSLSILKLCFYGRGVTEPWNECKNYDPIYPNDLILCRIEDTCEYSKMCSKYQRIVSYLS
jgi:hypothetical protein